MPTLKQIVARLEGVRPCADGWVARCPTHDDRHASLSVGLGDDGRVLLKCFAGCSFDAIRDALGGLPSPGTPGPPPASPSRDAAKRTGSPSAEAISTRPRHPPTLCAKPRSKRREPQAPARG
jgi:hypothetical protein